MAECPCTNISIMQLFHELKQKFPLIPDRVVSECIKKNGHDRVVLETVLERENRAYLLHSFPAAVAAAMSCHGEDCEEDVQQLQAAQLMRFQHGRQSLDSITRKTTPATRKSVTFRSVASDEQLHRCCTGESAGATSRQTVSREQCDDRCCCNKVKPRRLTTGADLKLELASASGATCCTCKRTSVSVVSSYAERPASSSLSRSAPVTPCGCGTPAFPPVTVDVSARKHRTQLSLEPTAPFARFNRHSDCCSRPFTRVNLVLRTPSTDPQPPIDIASTAGGGLTYSSCSYDPRQGFQSRLQISIGPGGRGGCVSATRTRPPPFPSSSRLRPATSLPDVTTTSALLNMPADLTSSLDPDKQALVSKQLEQKQRLEKELQREKEKLRFMQKEIELMERRLDGASTTMSTSSALHSRSNKVQELRDEILRLREECKRMTSEVDQSDVPLGETSEEFYRHIYTEQRSCPASLPVIPTHNEIDASHIPRHSSLDLSSSEQREAASGSAAAAAAAGDGPSWTCHVCTFRNHPLLKQCEQCDMPRINLGTTSMASTRSHPTAALT